MRKLLCVLLFSLGASAQIGVFSPGTFVPRSAGGSPVTLVVSCPLVGVVSSSPATTASCNTTGATLLVVSIAYTNLSATYTISDSKSNTWTCLTAKSQVGDGGTQLCYAFSPTVGTSHTFSVAISPSTSQRATIGAMAFNNTLSGSGVFDQQTGGTGASTTCAAGSLTPAVAGELFVTGLTGNGLSATSLTINSSYTIPTGGTNTATWDSGMAYFVDSTTTAQNPTWTIAGDSILSCTHAAFKP